MAFHLGQLGEQRGIATKRRIADIDPGNYSVALDEKGSVSEQVSSECLIGVSHLVSGIRENDEIEPAILLKASPRQLRRVGADGNHSCANFAEERQILVDIAKLPNAIRAVIAVIEDQDQQAVGP